MNYIKGIAVNKYNEPIDEEQVAWYYHKFFNKMMYGGCMKHVAEDWIEGINEMLNQAEKSILGALIYANTNKTITEDGTRTARTLLTTK